MGAEGAGIDLGTISRPAELEYLEALQEFITGCASAFGLDRKRTGRLCVALEEIFVNICHYAYPQGPGPVEVSCRSADGRLLIRIVDEGQPFDAATVAAPDLEADVESRKIGGLGWFLVRQAVDELHCYREHERNIVSLALKR